MSQSILSIKLPIQGGQPSKRGGRRRREEKRRKEKKREKKQGVAFWVGSKVKRKPSPSQEERPHMKERGEKEERRRKRFGTQSVKIIESAHSVRTKYERKHASKPQLKSGQRPDSVGLRPRISPKHEAQNRAVARKCKTKHINKEANNIHEQKRAEKQSRVQQTHIAQQQVRGCGY